MGGEVEAGPALSCRFALQTLLTFPSSSGNPEGKLALLQSLQVLVEQTRCAQVGLCRILKVHRELACVPPSPLVLFVLFLGFDVTANLTPLALTSSSNRPHLRVQSIQTCGSPGEHGRGEGRGQWVEMDRPLGTEDGRTI